MTCIISFIERLKIRTSGPVRARSSGGADQRMDRSVPVTPTGHWIPMEAGIHAVIGDIRHAG